MIGGFFRERKHYRLQEISEELGTALEKTKRLMGILKKYGVVKIIPSAKPEYEELSSQDIILTDILETGINAVYLFDFVGIVVIEDCIFKCYPKYIVSTTKPLQQLKQVLKVIKKYNAKEQLVYLYHGDGENRIFNRLAVSLYLLENYFQDGIYTNQQEIIETNGSGEILWDQTIHETYALIQKNCPYYVELQTRGIVDNETDYIRRLHECVLSQCTKELRETDVLTLFDIAEAELTTASLDEFGSAEYIQHRIERELQTQFVTKKRTVLKTLYAYISNTRAEQENLQYSLFGTNSFNLVWEKVCATVFGDMRNRKLSDLPTKVSEEYAARSSETLLQIIDRPIWHGNHLDVFDDGADTLKPDILCIYPVREPDEYCFAIYDAKYYCIQFKKQDEGYKITGQPGIQDIVKQYLYRLAYDDFIDKQGYRYVQNMFLCPHEGAGLDFGSVDLKMLHTIDGKKLGSIRVVKLCAGELFEIYLQGEPIKHITNITEYIPQAFEMPNGTALYGGVS